MTSPAAAGTASTEQLARRCAYAAAAIFVAELAAIVLLCWAAIEATGNARAYADEALVLGLLAVVLVAAAVVAVSDNSRETARTEQRAEHVEQRFRQFAEVASDWFCELDRDLRIVYLSDRFCELTGTPLPSVIGQPWPELARRPWLTMQAPTHFEDLKSHKPFRGHILRHRAPDTTERFWSLSGTPVFAAGGEFLGYRATGSEITDLVRANRELQSARDATERASVAKSAFLANMSHELRTPLNAIIGFSEVMKEQLYGPLGSEHYESYVENIRTSGRHLLSLINDILDLSRVEAGKLDLREERIYFSEIVDSAVSLCRERAERAGVRIVKELRETPCIVGDTVRLKQILINLLSNAVKFTPSAGRVYVRTEPAGDGGLAVSVEDTGIGMSPADIEVALKPFGQVDNGLSRKYEGTGLGLPLAKTLVERHGGKFSIASEPSRGTTVTFTLPATRVVTAELARATA